MINGKKVVALCIAKVNDGPNHELVVALNERLKDIGASLFVYATMSDLFWNIPDETGEASVFDIIDYKNTDVIVIYEDKFKNKSVVERIITKAKAFGTPVIIFGADYKGCAGLDYDYEKGFESVVRHIIEVHKPKRPHHMGGLKGEPNSEKRVSIFRKVVEENGYKFDESMVSYGEFWSNPTVEAMEALFLKSEAIPDAIVCANDAMAITVCAELGKRSIAVPDEVIVSGFDGIIDVKFNNPAITSSYCSADDAADTIMGMVCRMLGGEKVTERILIQPRTKPSESCGCTDEDSYFTSSYLMQLNGSLARFIADTRALSEISSGFQFSETLEEAVGHISVHVAYDMDFIIDKMCDDETLDPTESKYYELGDTLCNMFSSDHPYRKPFDFPAEDIVPDLPAIMERNMPIIFMALNYADVPLGYTCTHFNNYDIANYIRLPLIVTSINTAITGYRSMHYQRHLTKKIEEMYKKDALTGLYNRSGFMRDYEKARLKGRFSDRITTVLVDLDGLKKINDKYGHIEGDNAIRTAALAFSRQFDENAMGVRFGGDEMLVVYDGEYDCEKIKADIETYLDAYNLTSQKPYKVKVSVGYWVGDALEKIDFDELLKTTDKLMYLDKARKKRR